MTNSEKMKAVEAFCVSNLADCCDELLELSDTGILSNGKVREAMSQLTFVESPSRRRIIESIVNREALRRCGTKGSPA